MPDDLHGWFSNEGVLQYGLDEKTDRMIVVVTVFWFGFEALLAQVLLLREFLGIIGGNELFLGLFYGGWFLGVFAGAAAAARMRPQAERTPRIAALLLALQAVWAAEAIVLIRCWRQIAGTPEGTLLPFSGMALGVVATAFPFSALTGFLFPLLCGLWSARRARNESPLFQTASNTSSRAAVGSVYGLESLGSMAGGVVAAFFVMDRMRPLPAAVWAAACVCAVAAALIWKTGLIPAEEKKASKRTPMAACTGLASLAVVLGAFPLTPLFGHIEEWSAAQRWRSLAGNMNRVADLRTRYQQIDLGELEGQYSLLLDGQFAGSFPDPIAAAAQAHLVMAETPGARRVLLLGGAVTGVVPELLRYPGLTIDCAELDPGVRIIVEGRLPPELEAGLHDPRFRLHWVDGRRFVKEAARRIRRGEGEPYDLIVSLAPDPTNASLNRYFTREFFREARSILRPDGVFVLRIGSAVNYFGPEVRKFTGSVYASLRNIFPSVIATPGETACVFASSSGDRLTSDPLALAARFRSSGVESPDFRPEHFQMDFERGHTEKTNAAFERESATVALNSDLHPVTYLFGLRLWGFYSGSEFGAFVGALERIQPGWVFACAGAAIALWMIYASGRRRNARRILALNALIGIALTGMSGMGVSLALLFAFQNLFGFLYREIGLLVGIFMAGLACGGFAFRNPTGRKSAAGSRIPPARPLIALIVWQGIVSLFLAFSAMALFLFTTRVEGLASLEWAGRLGLNGLMFLAGYLTGAVFPLVGHVESALGVELTRRAAWLESADHLGAAAGALLTGLFFIPRLGPPATLLFFAMLNLGGAAILATTLFRRSHQS